jgi:ribosomal protein L40E
MKCPKCNFENPEGMNFCGRCGVKIELVCPSCNASNPPGFTFCGKCGKNLILQSEPLCKELSFDEKLEKIQKYLPKGITEKILSQRDKIEGEKRQVTVMFCDMKGFTPLSEKLGPEGMYAMMDEVYEILIHRVHAYEGTVNEMTGDGVMALFGAPIALEDAPQRALRSAMSIHREISRYNEKVKREKGDLPNIQMRIGIHTGPVVVESRVQGRRGYGEPCCPDGTVGGAWHYLCDRGYL